MNSTSCYGRLASSALTAGIYLARAGEMPDRAGPASTQRVLATREALGESAQTWPTLTADASLLLDAAKPRRPRQVVVTTAGPYTCYGCRRCHARCRLTRLTPT